jgi:uncharacterized membrane protein YphA (DoxX/SURF4 family)
MDEVPRRTALVTRETDRLRLGPAAGGEQQWWERLPRPAVVDRVVALNQRWAPVAVRMALALVFVWFGVLKIAGVSPVGRLLSATLPFVNQDVLVPVLGVVEVVIGLAVATGRMPRLVLLVLVGHLVGTFLTFVTASGLMWQPDRLLALTVDGEFVIKNLVLISAALLLIGWHSKHAGDREGC